MPESTVPIVIRRLGLQPYEPVWRAMQAFTAAREAGTPDEFWILQHPPVFTQGQAGKADHLLAPGEIPVIPVDRGGQVTYHGPGQLVIYLLVDLARRELGTRALVTRIEESLVAALAGWGIAARPRQDAPGVYTEDGRKIASLGLRVRRQGSYHGLALNVDMDLEPFSRINPCGLAGMAMTQVADFAPGVSVDSATGAVLAELLARLPSAVPQESGRLPSTAELNPATLQRVV